MSRTDPMPSTVSWLYLARMARSGSALDRRTAIIQAHAQLEQCLNDSGYTTRRRASFHYACSAAAADVGFRLPLGLRAAVMLRNLVAHTTYSPPGFVTPMAIRSYAFVYLRLPAGVQEIEWELDIPPSPHKLATPKGVSQRGRSINARPPHRVGIVAGIMLAGFVFVTFGLVVVAFGSLLLLAKQKMPDKSEVQSAYVFDRRGFQWVKSSMSAVDAVGAETMVLKSPNAWTRANVVEWTWWSESGDSGASERFEYGPQGRLDRVTRSDVSSEGVDITIIYCFGEKPSCQRGARGEHPQFVSCSTLTAWSPEPSPNRNIPGLESLPAFKDLVEPR